MPRSGDGSQSISVSRKAMPTAWAGAAGAAAGTFSPSPAAPAGCGQLRLDRPLGSGPGTPGPRCNLGQIHQRPRRSPQLSPSAAASPSSPATSPFLGSRLLPPSCSSAARPLAPGSQLRLLARSTAHIPALGQTGAITLRGSAGTGAAARSRQDARAAGPVLLDGQRRTGSSDAALATPLPGPGGLCPCAAQAGMARVPRLHPGQQCSHTCLQRPRYHPIPHRLPEQRALALAPGCDTAAFIQGVPVLAPGYKHQPSPVPRSAVPMGPGGGGSVGASRPARVWRGPRAAPRHPAAEHRAWQARGRGLPRRHPGLCPRPAPRLPLPTTDGEVWSSGCAVRAGSGYCANTRSGEGTAGKGKQLLIYRRPAPCRLVGCGVKLPGDRPRQSRHRLGTQGKDRVLGPRHPWSPGVCGMLQPGAGAAPDPLPVTRTCPHRRGSSRLLPTQERLRMCPGWGPGRRVALGLLPVGGSSPCPPGRAAPAPRAGTCSVAAAKRPNSSSRNWEPRAKGSGLPSQCRALPSLGSPGGAEAAGACGGAGSRRSCKRRGSRAATPGDPRRVAGWGYPN